MNAFQKIGAVAMGLAATAGLGHAAPLEFRSSLIELPESARQADTCAFFEIGSNGLADLFLLDPARNELLIRRQKASGFEQTPDQILALPAQTAWVSVADVDPHPGRELVVSTATGIFCFEQNAGVFDSQPRPLIQATQVFTNKISPILATLPRDGTNEVIPIIAADKVVPYTKGTAFNWTPSPSADYAMQNADWGASRSDWGNILPQIRRTKFNQYVAKHSEWAMGSNPALSLICNTDIQENGEDRMDPTKKAEDDAVQKLVKPPQRPSVLPWSGIERADLNGDGREDLLLWNVIPGMNFQTDIFTFLRGADNRLPDHPTQILHCRGFPLPLYSEHRISPVHDLRGDGHYELVILSLNTTVLGASGAMDVLVSGTIDWSVTIRTFDGERFSKSPDASFPVTVPLSSMQSVLDMILLGGDFNGDGRPDLLVQRSGTKWDLFASISDRNWFAKQPAATLEIPFAGNFETRDLNGDGLSDLIVRADDQQKLLIFMSQSSNRRAR